MPLLDTLETKISRAYRDQGGLPKRDKMAELLNKIKEEDWDEDQAGQALSQLEPIMYTWAQNLGPTSDPKAVELFYNFAAEVVELAVLQDEFSTAGRYYEAFQIFVAEQSGAIIPEAINVEEFYLHAAEAYLQEGNMKADECLKKMRNHVNRSDPMMWIRYKSAQSRVLDIGRRYGAASYAFFQTLRDAETMEIDLDDQSKIMTLNNAAICAILDKHGPPRTAILNKIKAHHFGGTIPVANILSKVCNNEIVTPQDLTLFEGELAEQHRAVMGNGRTIVQNAMIRHNVSVVSKIYKRISLSTLAEILGNSEAEAEQVITNMILKEGLKAMIDGVAANIEFDPSGSTLVDWENQIEDFCMQLDTVCGKIAQ